MESKDTEATAIGAGLVLAIPVPLTSLRAVQLGITTT